MTEKEEILAGALHHLLRHYVCDVRKSMRKHVYEWEVVKQAEFALATVGIDPYAE